MQKYRYYSVHMWHCLPLLWCSPIGVIIDKALVRHSNGLTTYLASDVLLDEQVLPIVVEDDVDLLGARSADVWAEHNIVGGLSIHLGGFYSTGEHL